MRGCCVEPWGEKKFQMPGKTNKVPCKKNEVPDVGLRIDWRRERWFFPVAKKRRAGHIKNEAQVCRICFFSYICDYINKIVSYGLRP